MTEKTLLQMCRTCLQEGLNYVCLGTGKDSYRHKLIICIPEINVDVLENPSLCGECAFKLDEVYDFKSKCLENEEKLINILSSAESLVENEADQVETPISIKQEPDTEETIIFELVNNEKDSESEACALTIKEEPEFFYSEYDVDSNENNQVNLTNHEVNVVNASEILNEHSYFLTITAGTAISNTILSWNQTQQQKEAAQTVDPKKDGYLTVKVDTEKKYMCRYCNKIFDESDDLYDHIHAEHKERFLSDNASKEFLCKICNVYFNEEIIKRHMETHKEEIVDGSTDSINPLKLICRVCGAAYSDEKLFTSHFQTHKQGPMTITCTVCGETYDQLSVKAHMEFHNIVEEIVINSDFDRTNFLATDAELNAKYSVEHPKAGTSSSEVTNYRCCNEDFNNLYLFHLHTTKVHGYICYVCDIKFLHKQGLIGHFRTHSEQQTHQCRDCGKYFAQRGNLLRHRHFVHNCVMQYKCDQCGERFRWNKYLEEHLKTHMQKYACTDCNQVFTEMKLLRKHKRIHRLPPHQCGICNTVFSAKSSLLRHQRDVHKLKITAKRSYGLGEVLLGST